MNWKLKCCYFAFEDMYITGWSGPENKLWFSINQEWFLVSFGRAVLQKCWPVPSVWGSINLKYVLLSLGKNFLAIFSNCQRSEILMGQGISFVPPVNSNAAKITSPVQLQANLKLLSGTTACALQKKEITQLTSNYTSKRNYSTHIKR